MQVTEHKSLVQAKKHKHLIINLLKIVMGLFVTLFFYLICLMPQSYPANQKKLLTMMFYLLSLLLSRMYNATQFGQERISELVVSQGVTLSWAHTFMFLSVFVLEAQSISLLRWGFSMFITSLFALLWTILANRIYFLLYPAMKSIVVYGDVKSSETLEQLYTYPKMFRVEKAVRAESFSNQFDSLKDYEAVFINEVPSELRNDILKFCACNGIKVFVRPKISDLLLSGSRQVKLFGLPVLTMRQNEPHQLYCFIKRAGDIAFSLAGLLFASPIFLVLALLIKRQDGGRIFYQQQRLTKNGKVFTLYKFRSMRENAEADGVARLATENDSRITPIGRFIRSTRLDELPQLYNVLKGEMSFVGPRPERPEIAKAYARDFPEFKLRLRAKAGLTGFAQVYGRYNTEPYTKLQMDLIYISNQNIFTDMKLIFSTLRILLKKESTQGVEEGQVTAASREMIDSDSAFLLAPSNETNVKEL